MASAPATDDSASTAGFEGESAGAAAPPVATAVEVEVKVEEMRSPAGAD